MIVADDGDRARELSETWWSSLVLCRHAQGSSRGLPQVAGVRQDFFTVLSGVEERAGRVAAMRVRFGPYVLDLESRQLLRGDDVVHLSPKAFELLSILVSHRPKALSKSDLQERLWPGTFVVEKNLANLVSEIRDAFGDDPANPRFIRTVHRFGYAFRETVPRGETGRPASRGGDVSFRLKWMNGRVTLEEGEHVIGRDPDTSMKGPLESRHTSSERADAREHARRIAIRARAARRRSRDANGFGDPVSALPHRLRAPDVCDASIRARHTRRAHSQVGPRAAHSEFDDASLRPGIMRSPDTPHVERTSCAYVGRGHGHHDLVAQHARQRDAGFVRALSARPGGAPTGPPRPAV